MGMTACFTGHRPQKLGGFQGPNANAVQIPLKQRIANVIERAMANGFDTFISGGALGVDQWAAEAIINMKLKGVKIKLIIARPFPSQSGNWPEKSKQHFAQLCDYADEVVDVSPDPYEPGKMLVRDQWMVNRSDLVLAFWDGTSGGTGHTVKYAQEMGVKVFHVDPHTLKETVL